MERGERQNDVTHYHLNRGAIEQAARQRVLLQKNQSAAPTSSLYFKGKQIPIADIAKMLGVAYVLEGSVRKSGARLRVAARLIRADNGCVVWSETYDRPLNDILTVQDDLASEVTKALKASIEARPDHGKNLRMSREQWSGGWPTFSRFVCGDHHD